VPDTLPLTIRDAAAELRAGTLTSVALTTAVLDTIAQQDAVLGAYVTVTGDAALAAAAAADADFAAGVDRSPLQGIPLAVKDIIATRDAPTTANSRVLDPDWGAGVDAPVVARLRAAGAVTVGKTTTSEFACGLPDPTKGFPIPRNPWNLEHTASGSSAGTGIAVAAGLALGGLGTDTGGSVRAPASVSGITGLKVTFGRVPKNGVVPLGYSLDSVGPMARSAYDCALLLEVMAGYDAGDPTAADVPVPRYSGMLDGDVRGLRIGVPHEYFLDDPLMAEEVRAAVLAGVAHLESLGAEVVDVTIPHAGAANDANNLTFLAEGYAYHRANLQTRWLDYGKSTRDVLARGAMYTGADYVQAQRVRSVFRAEVAKVMAEVDVLVTPLSLGPVPKAAEMDMGFLFTMASFTGQWNLTGMPAASVPCGMSESGLPLALQVVGRPFAEGTVLKVADAYQRGTDWHLQVPTFASPAEAVLTV
jgi:aspartyl-tRNA(Asn)/glutamyl-tRNA(Gln) amidotransferase subunit A